MIDVDAMGRSWGAAIWRRFTDTGQGHPPTSHIARIHELHDAAASGTQKLSQFREEALTGDARLFALCLLAAPIELRQVAYLHYVERRNVREKARYAGWTTGDYYRWLDNMRYFIAGRVGTLQGVDAAEESERLTSRIA